MAGPAVLLKGDSNAQTAVGPALAALPIATLAATLKIITLDVQNMTCEVCPITVKKSLEKVSGVNAVKIDYTKKTATVTYDVDKTKPENLTRATTDAGYPSTVRL